jgi:hypothetical protein
MSDTLRDTVNARRAETRNTTPSVGAAVAVTGFGPPDHARILALIGLNPSDPKAHAVVAVAERYGLDPVLGHIQIIGSSRMPYITRDGFLFIAHRSGQLDGIEVVDGPRRDEREREWTALVAVYRKDMGRPFTYPGRAELGRDNGPEMALARAERRALRRAFAVTLPSAFVEDEYDTRAQPPQPLTGEQLKAIQMEYKGITKTRRLASISDIVGHRIESANELTRDEARDVLARLAEQQHDDASKAAWKDDWEKRGPQTPKAPASREPESPGQAPAPVIRTAGGDAAGGEPGPPVPDPAAPPTPATTAQRKEIVARFAQLGRTDPADVLGQITAWVGREIGSTSDLTDTDAVTVLAALAATEPPNARAD